VPIDLVELDRSLRCAWVEWRSALDELRLRPEARPPSPLERWPVLRSEHSLHELERFANEPLGVALYGWVRALAMEHAAWASRVEEALGWAAAVEVLEDRVPIRELRRRAIRTVDPTERMGWGRAFAAAADRVAGAIRWGLAVRADHERALGMPGEGLRAAVGLDRALGARVAEALIDATEPMARELVARDFCDGLHQALARAADAGWPAALTARSARALAGAVGGAPTRAASFAVPEPWGALSFARALGSLGVAGLDAERQSALQFAPLLLPRGPKRHQRFALLASVVAERCFARHSLGLGQERARAHQRTIGRAFVRSLRFDALRVLVGQALADSPDAAQERFQQLAPRVFGAPMPAELMAVVPAVGVGAGAMLVGRVLGVRARQAAQDELGEDWYRNPRSVAWLRAQACVPEATIPTADEAVLAAVTETSELLAAIC
jgi:hypothetical protein